MKRSRQKPLWRSSRRRSPTFRSASTSTSLSAGSAATFATSASTRTRTPRKWISTWRCSGASGSCTRTSRRLAGRPFNFVYFGGGTPSFLSIASARDARRAALTASRTWGTAEEITFECEPGTITGAKLSAIRQIGVTRLSLGVENFDDRILELNGRAHRSPEIDRVYREARSLGFPQINIDLIAGMLGETDENWALVRSTHSRPRAGQRDHLPDGAPVQHDD